MSLQSHPAPQFTGGTAPRGVPGALPAEPGAFGASGSAGPVPGTLKGRNVGLLCDDPSLPEALLAYRAAIDLGAHVSLVRPRFGGAEEAHAIPETARMLGRLYDVIACVALPRTLVEAVRDASGVPVVGDIDIDARGAIDLDATAAERLHLWQRALAATLA